MTAALDARSPRDVRFEGELDGIASRAAEALERSAVRAATERALARAWVPALVVPATAVLVEAAARASGLASPLPPLVWLLGATIALPALFVAVVRVAAALRPIDRLHAIGIVDREVGAGERLLTAAEFLRSPAPRSPFVEAAIADAERFFAPARAAAVERAFASPTVPRSLAAATLAGAFALVALQWLPAPAVDAASERTAGESVAGEEIAATAPREADRAEPPPRSDPPRPEETGTKTDDRERGEHTPGRAREERLALSDEVKKTRGSLGDGRAADASSATSSGEAKGTPTNQAQSGEASKKPATPKAHQPKPGRDPAGERMPPKEPEEDSGATAGRGAAAGSNKSPASSPWSSTDQVVSEDEEDLEQDEEVDDEHDDSDARGGLQPNLRDRRPPVNRDLGIGFGNAKNPDANGRGGPSEQKKSRGVASLVLGVPIPDHVKGKPNPGRTKITQERVEPKAESADPIDAEARTARDAPVGHLSHPDLLPWMRDLVRAYYLKLRTESGE